MAEVPPNWDPYTSRTGNPHIDRDSEFDSSDDTDLARDDRRMISWNANGERLREARNLTLKWGEYYLSDDAISSDDGSDVMSVDVEEAEEVPEEEAEGELDRVIARVKPAAKERNRVAHDDILLNYIRNDEAKKVPSSSPSLMGMPDILLEKILHYATDEAAKVCGLETVNKRMMKLVVSDEFWLRHPLYSTTAVRDCCGEGKNEPTVCTCTPRERALRSDCISRIRSYQEEVCDNQILAVLGAEAFRDVASHLLSQMIHLGCSVHFRLRGDTVGYLAEILQAQMVGRLEEVLFFAIHTGRLVVEMEDVQKGFQRGGRTLGPYFTLMNSSSQKLAPRCHVGMKEHGKMDSVIACSCSLPLSSGIVWRWPDGDCHDVLPPEAGRRIIRRLAYLACIVEMTGEAFALAEAELLHMMGVLLVDAYESSVAMSKTASFVDPEEAISYRVFPTGSIDMFNVPPPPLHPATYDNGNVHQEIVTIVPGHIKDAADKRNIVPSTVYGDTWVASSGFTAEEEKAIEESYYYEDVKSSDEDGDDDQDIGKKIHNMDIDEEEDSFEYVDGGNNGDVIQDSDSVDGGDDYEYDSDDFDSDDESDPGSDIDENDLVGRDLQVGRDFFDVNGQPIEVLYFV